MDPRQNTKSVLCARCLKRVPVVVLRQGKRVIYQGAYYDCCAKHDESLARSKGKVAA